LPQSVTLEHLSSRIAGSSPSPIYSKIALLFRSTRVIHVVTAVITAKGESIMTTSSEETALRAPASDRPEPSPKTKASKPARKPKGGAPSAKAAPAKGKASKKATPAKNAAKGKKTAKARESAGPREGSKTAQVVVMLQRKDGATITEIMRKMNWQKHTVRGFMAGAMKKGGYTVESFKPAGGERTYRINA
jgi:Protein of unknown function (DUF3489)